MGGSVRYLGPHPGTVCQILHGNRDFAYDFEMGKLFCII